MFNIFFNLLLFVGDILFAVSAYNSAHYAWACILSGCAGAMFMVTGLAFINRN